MKKLSKIALFLLPVFLGLTLVMPQEARAQESAAQRDAYAKENQDERNIYALQKQLDTLLATQIKAGPAYDAWNEAKNLTASALTNIGVAEKQCPPQTRGDRNWSCSAVDNANNIYDQAQANEEAAKEAYLKTLSENTDVSTVRDQLAAAQKDLLQATAAAAAVYTAEHPVKP